VADAVGERTMEALWGVRPRLGEQTGTRQHRPRAPQLRERKAEDAPEVARRDGDARSCEAPALEPLGDQAAEGVADDHGGRGELGDDLRVVIGHGADAAVGDVLGVSPDLGGGRSVTGPAGRDRLETTSGEHLEPWRPARGVQPQTVDEDDGRTDGISHGGLHSESNPRTGRPRRGAGEFDAHGIVSTILPMIRPSVAARWASAA
jgi:hypothetical protein